MRARAGHTDLKGELKGRYIYQKPKFFIPQTPLLGSIWRSQTNQLKHLKPRTRHALPRS